MVIRLKTIEDASEFSRVCEDYESPVDVKRGRYIVDGKSFLGVMGFGLETELEVEMITDNEDLRKDFEEHIEKFKA